MVKFWMLTLRIGRKAIGQTTHNASPRPKFLATKYQKSHVRFKDLQLFGGTAAFHHSYGPKSCSLYLQPVRSKTSNIINQTMKTISAKTWDTFKKRKLTNEQVCDTTLMIFMWQYCSRKTSNFEQWNAIITSPLSTSLLLLICSRKSFLGCTVVSAPNGPQSQVPPDHMGEAWAKGASGSVSNRHAACNETVLKHTHWKTSFEKASYKKSDSYGLSQLKSFKTRGCAELYRIVPNGFTALWRWYLFFRKLHLAPLLLKICDRAQLRCAMWCNPDPNSMQWISDRKAISSALSH